VKLFCCQLGFHFDSFSHISIIHYPNGFDMNVMPQFGAAPVDIMNPSIVAKNVDKYCLAYTPSLNLRLLTHKLGGRLDYGQPCCFLHAS
jgi:hypothetical protein